MTKALLCPIQCICALECDKALFIKVFAGRVSESTV